MSKILYFYATKSDVLAVTSEIESKHPIKYVHFGHTTCLRPETFTTAEQIPHLGIASHPSAVAGDKFLVCDAAKKIQGRQLKTLTEADAAKSDFDLKPLIGKTRYAIDQLGNPDTISFAAGGTWKDGTLLHGSIGTASKSKRSLSLMREFELEIKKQFVRVKAFYVGPEALQLLKNGKRLTAAQQSPPEYDLKPGDLLTLQE